MVEWRIELLDPTHERGAFHCGKAPLDAFLQQHAAGNAQLGVSRVYVATLPGERRVLGFYASSAGTFTRKSLPKEKQEGLPGYPLPTAHLGRLAVDKSCQGQGLGKILLFHFLEAVLEAAEKIGIFAVDVVAKDEESRAFYQKYGFLALQDNPFHLYLPIGTVRAMFEQAGE